MTACSHCGLAVEKGAHHWCARRRMVVTPAGREIELLGRQAQVFEELWQRLGEHVTANKIAAARHISRNGAIGGVYRLRRTLDRERTGLAILSFRRERSAESGKIDPGFMLFRTFQRGASPRTGASRSQGRSEANDQPS